MAKVEILAPFLLSWEGGYNKVKGDKGGATNKGVTLATWRRYGYDKDRDGDIDEKDVMLITESDAVNLILKPVYWNSGVYGIKIPQKVLGVTVDGSVGPKTLAAINNYPDQRALFQKLWKERKAYFERLATDPSQKKFLAGWLNRLNGMGWDKLVCANKKVLRW